MNRWLPAFLIPAFVALALFAIVTFQSLLPEPAPPRSTGVEGLRENSTLRQAQIMLDAQNPGPITHNPTPPEVRGIYWTAQTAGTPRGDELLAYMQATGLNTVVIDTKMDDGELAFLPLFNGELEGVTAGLVQDDPAINDLDALLTKLGDAGIYRIARVAVMRDSAHALAHPERAMRTFSGGVWRDNTGAGWLDPASPEVADYAIALGREAYARGFDEIQFDYVRFASDGALSAITYSVFEPSTQTKEEVMAAFFKKVGGTFQKEGIPVSFDVFGMTFESSDDFNIGQRFADVYPYADFISPMVYPSHYADGFQGFANPAEHPYGVITHSLESGVKMMAGTYGLPGIEVRPKVRPWLQDFDIGAVYTADLIEAQINAARDAGASGWILWNARNVYEPADYLPN